MSEHLDWADVWDSQARTMRDARWAVWASNVPDWKAGQRMCMAHLAAMPPAGDLLDLGAGVGRLTVPVALQRPDARLWAVDVSRRMLGHLKVHAIRERARNVTIRRTEGRHIPNDVPTLAGAWSVLTFQHLPASQQRRYLLSMADKLEPGAPLIVQFVEGGEGGPLSNPVHSLEMWEWMDEAGISGDIVLESPSWPTWRWMHGQKR